MLTLKEAQTLMKKGVKISHDYFGKNEWVTSDKKGKTCFTEEGCSHKWNRFFDKTRKNWKKGWKLFEPITNPKVKLARKHCLASVKNWTNEDDSIQIIKGDKEFADFKNDRNIKNKIFEKG